MQHRKYTYSAFIVEAGRTPLRVPEGRIFEHILNKVVAFP